MKFQFCRGENHMQHVETAAMALSSAATRGNCLCASEKAPWRPRVHARVYATMWRNHIALQGNPLFKARWGLGVGVGDPHQRRECWARIPPTVSDPRLALN